MKVKAIWEFEFDDSDLDPKQVDITGLAKDSTRCELMYLMRKHDITADDFEYIVEKETTKYNEGMILVDITKLDYEPFCDENGETIDYISSEALYDEPRVDPVNHAEWVVTYRKSYSDPNKTHVVSNCSHCNQLEHVDIVPTDLWESGYKDKYNPENSNYCRNCGYKMNGTIFEHE